MPKDKTATHEKLIPIVRDEFLTYGYEKASVNRIAKTAGMSAAGLYRHYTDKEDMFTSLVEETVSGFRSLCREWERGTSGGSVEKDPFSDEWMRSLLDFVYEHFIEFRLLICCSAGSRYECFEEDLIRREEESSKNYAEQLRTSGRNPIKVTDEQWHLVATLYVRAIMEIIHHEMKREEAEEHIRFVQEFLYPGMKKLFGIS